MDRAPSPKQQSRIYMDLLFGLVGEIYCLLLTLFCDFCLGQLLIYSHERIYHVYTVPVFVRYDVDNIHNASVFVQLTAM